MVLIPVPRTDPEQIAAELLRDVTDIATAQNILALAVAKYIASDRENESLRQQVGFLRAFLEDMANGQDGTDLRSASGGQARGSG
jgi:hypothetical protein